MNYAKFGLRHHGYCGALRTHPTDSLFVGPFGDRSSETNIIWITQNLV